MSNAQYIRREMLDINPVSHSKNNVDLEEKVCKALSLTGTKVKPDDLDACHRMKKKDKVIIKFKNRKQRKDVIFKRKELKSKGDDLLALQSGRSLFINNSMCSVCNFQSMKSPVELNSLLSKFFCYVTWFVIPSD